MRMIILADAFTALRSATALEPRTHREPAAFKLALRPPAPPINDGRSSGLWARSLADRRLVTGQARMRPILIAFVVAVLFGCDPAVAQMDDTVSGVDATSPLGMTAGTTIPPTGNLMGATELTSAGLSPFPIGSPGVTGNGVACPAQAGSALGMSGTTTTYDGGGMMMGMPLPGSTAFSGTCGTSSTGGAASFSAMSTPSPGGASPAGIPLGSFETNNAGLSPLPVGPVPNPMPLVAGSSAYPSMTMAPGSSPPMVAAPSTFAPSVEIGGPCTTTGPTVPSMSSTGC